MVEFGTLGEVFIILCATLVLLGPKEIPTVLRTIGKFIYKFKKVTRHLQSHIDPYLNEGEFESFKRENNLWNEGGGAPLQPPKTSRKKPLKKAK